MAILLLIKLLIELQKFQILHHRIIQKKIKEILKKLYLQEKTANH